MVYEELSHPLAVFLATLLLVVASTAVRDVYETILMAGRHVDAGRAEERPATQRRLREDAQLLHPG